MENKMTYRITNDRPFPGLTPEERDNVRHAYRLDNDQVSLALGFDPGDTASPALAAHAVEMITGLLYVRGWCNRTPEVVLALASDWPDRAWLGARGPRAFVVQLPIESQDEPRTDDLDTIIELTTLVWSMEYRLLRTGQPIPDLMSAFAPACVTFASVSIDLWSQAVSGVLAPNTGQAGRHPDATRSPSSEYVDVHLDGTGVRTWSLPDRQAVFLSSACEAAHARAYLALEDTDHNPCPERARELLHLMLASGRDD